MPDLRWPTEDMPLASTRRRASEIAAHVGVELDYWEENGLGAACGFVMITPAGRMVQVRELAHIVEQGWGGAGIDVDAADVLDPGVDQLLAEVVDLFGLTDEDLIWRQAEGPDLLESAKQLVRMARATRDASRPAP